MAVNISRDNAFEGYTIFNHNHNLVYKGNHGYQRCLQNTIKQLGLSIGVALLYTSVYTPL